MVIDISLPMWHTARTAGVKVWKVITYDNRFTLIAVRETLTDQRPIDYIIQTDGGGDLS